MHLRRILAAALATATGAGALALAPAAPASASLTDGQAKFTKIEGGATFQWSSPVIGNLGGTDVVAVGGMNGTLYAYRADSSRVFATAVGGPIASSPAIGDVDGDGATEIVVGYGGDDDPAERNGGVVVLNGAGAERCRFRVPPRVDGKASVFNAPAIADVNGDGASDVVFGAFNDHIYAMNGACQVFADFDNQDTVWSSPATMDVDGDGSAEVFIGGDATAGGQPHSGGFFRRLDFEGGRFVQKWDRRASDTFQSSPAIGTVNGQLAIVTQTGNDYCNAVNRCGDSVKTWAFDVNGNDVPGWTGGRNMPARSFLNSPALGDVSGDGANDVVVASKDGTIRAYHGDGRTIWERNIGDTDLVGSPILVDVNGSGGPEVVVAATPRAYVLDGGNGSTIRQVSEGATGLAHKNTPAAGVLGGSWVVATAGFDPRTGNAGWLSVYDIPGPTSAPWPMFKKNARRLGADSSDPQPITCDAGYWLVASDGGIFSFGDAPFFGSTGDIRLNQPIVGMAPVPSRRGYRFVARDGGIFAFASTFEGSAGGSRLNSPIVGMAGTPSGNGYWLVAADGGIFTYGDAGFFGSAGGSPLNQPIVGMAATPTGKGYWLVARDGGIFSFGDATFFGSTGDIRLNQPIVGMAASPKGNGYWFVASDGGIFSFGPGAPFLGSTGNLTLNRPVVGMRATPSGNGYWFVATDGGIFSFGDAEFCGSTGNIRLNSPIVGMG